MNVTALSSADAEGDPDLDPEEVAPGSQGGEDDDVEAGAMEDVELEDDNDDASVTADPTGAPEAFVDEDADEKKGKSVPPPPRPEFKRGGPSVHALELGTDQKSLEDRASIFGLWFLTYLSPLLKLGASKTLEQEDIGVPSECDLAEPTFAMAQTLWREEIDRVRTLNETGRQRHGAKIGAMSAEQRRKAKPYKAKEPSVASILASGFGKWKIAWAMISYTLSALFQFIPVILLEDLVKYFETGSYRWAHPWVEVAGLAVIPAFISLLQTRSQATFLHLAIYVRTAVSTLLYEKSLGVSAAGRAATSTGQVVNMMSNDTTQLQRFLQFGGMTLVAPVQIVLALVLIYGQVGNATWVGVAFMVSLAPVNVVVFSIVGKQRRKVLKFSDLRVKMMNELLSGIRIIKFYAWEKPFGKEVGKVREKELDALTKLAYTSSIGFSLILLSAPILQPILVFLTYINIQDEPLTASTAFTTVALFNIMRFPFAFLPMGMLQFIQSRISLRRLGKYLRLPELEQYVVNGPPPPTKGDDGAGSEAVAKPGSVTLTGGSFAWVHPDRAVAPLEDRNDKKKGGKRGSRAGRRRSSSASAKSSASEGNDNNDDLAADTSHSAMSDLEGSRRGIADPVTLKDITCTLEAGSLVAVVGAVGSGKSSLLSAMLGEMEPLEGAKVYLPRDDDLDNKNKTAVDRTNFFSYFNQTPWVINDTLRGNILFGRPFHQERYDEVVEACALLDDLAVLPAGDSTEIGERGINLSGGQKARVSLARALYSPDAKLLLLDDPLSAVDAHVGEHLFSGAISGKVSEGTTRVLVTHHVHVLPRCDKVIVMEGGRIQHMGTYAELIERGVDFAGAVDVSKGDDGDKEGKDGEASDAENGGKDEAKKESGSKEGGKGGGKDAAAAASTPTKGSDKGGPPEKHSADAKKKGSELTTKEEREEGAVGGSHYIHYARAGGFFSFISIVIIQAVGRGSEVMAAFWLSLWAERTVSASLTDTPLSDAETTWYLNIYAAFGVLGVVCLTGRSLLMAVHRLHASRKLHDDLVGRVLRAPVAFFDVTPTGRILNRFAADMDKIDLDLTNSIGQGFSTIFSVLGALGAIVAATKGTFLIPLAPISYVYYVIQKWFRRTSTELQRVTAIAISPIFADFSQVLSGTSTIRAYEGQERFFAKCQKSFDDFNASYNLQQMCNFWLGLRLDILGGFIGAFIGGIAVGTASYNFIPAGWLGLALSYSIEVTGYLKHGVRMIATVEADMNSVERVLYYSENIDSEAPDVIPDRDPVSSEWPSKGKIEVVHASMRYRDGPLVLKDITVSIDGGEKIGVVGRTGSGKSSLMNLLFRITEAEADGGRVLIDGVDTFQIGTEALRLNLSIIPQDPVMFSNTVRYNLDPFGTATDDMLWDVLKKVQLADVIAGLPKGLEDMVAEGGENFSQGQRQLLCIARSLLRDPKILVMDEATASIDNATDAAVQRMIRENFGEATVLTIAHRLGTIMDSDRVLVLDDGRVAEFDSPEKLMETEGGIFRAMVEKSRTAHEMDDADKA